MEKKFYRPELTATQNETLFCEELIDDWKDRTEDLRQIAPPDSAEEYFTLLLLKNRFERLPEEYRDQVAQELAWIQSTVENLTDEQITEAVNLFDAEYWLKNLKEASEMWMNEEIGRIEMFNSGTGFMSDLDGFGVCLVYGTKRGVCSFLNPSHWDQFFICCQELEKNLVIPVVLDRWIQSAAALIREDVELLEDETESIVEYFETLLDQIEFREHQERGDRWYQEYLLALFHSFARGKQMEQLQPRIAKRKRAQIQTRLYGGGVALMAAAPDEEPEPEQFFLLSPSKPWKALVMFKENEVRIRFYQKDAPEVASELIGRTVRFCGFPRKIEQNGEVCFSLSACGDPISLEVDEEQSGPFVQWVKES